MLDPNSAPGIYALLLLGLLSGLLGLYGLLRRQRRAAAPWKAPLVLAAVLSAAGAALAVAGLPLYTWWPATVLGLVMLGLAVLRSPVPAWLGRHLLRLASQPRLQAVALFLAGVGLIIAQAYQLDQQVEQELATTDQLLVAFTTPPALDPVAERPAFTDTGRQVELWRTRAKDDPEGIIEQELAFLRNLGLEQYVIRTSGVELQYNCHGWVFTGGRYWVKGSSVPDILRDNNYEVVSRPGPGDLAVYRSVSGEVMHTALVRAIREDGTILLESKWGRLGCFIHTDSRHAYGNCSCTYYRTGRGGHLLRGQYAEGQDRI
jgi:hypothetical protein